MTDLGAILADGQALADFRMTDTCAVTRAAPGTGTFDPVTGLFSGATTAVYTGKCRLRVPGTVSASKSRESAGDEAAMVTAILSVPVSAAALRIGDRVTINASPFSPHLAGSAWSVDGLIPGSQQTAQKVSLLAVID